MPNYGQKIAEIPLECRIVTRMDPHLLSKARRFADKQNITLSALVRSLLREKVGIAAAEEL